MAKGWLYELSLLFPEKAVAREQASAQAKAGTPLDQARLMEFWGLLHQNLSNQFRVIQ